MARPKTSIVDIIRTLYWYDSTYFFLTDSVGINTLEGFSNFFHESLENDNEILGGDSNFFWKIKQGRTTLGKKWLKRIEKKCPSSIIFYNHFIWRALRNIPTSEIDTRILLKEAPTYLTDYIFNRNGSGLPQNELTEHNLIKIQSFYNLDSLGVLFLLHLLAYQINDLSLANYTEELIHSSYEKVSLQKGLERVHLFLFTLIDHNIYHTEFQGFNSPIYRFHYWRGDRDSEWSLENKHRSTQAELEVIQDSYLAKIDLQILFESKKSQEIITSGFDHL
ncbi:hypothetical protein ABH305_10100 [Acinetobacter pittii]|uniref:hypothetical protein n=1 Tax=Acinetobacter calcoaceticus/baumannii complex TaxID=909768 RepID=UPI0021CE1C68|nr:MULTISPECIES: hypothetical protein [Acinetobacter calcoaceticus/baumannii complex]EKT8144806.1 hypothetical protein [Acinetobacter baumannii]EKU7083139.1 hypothetical protein [Acinetobacter baumannii]EKV1040563.1 hypothetical protein [Acinetobacter baumannii]EKV1044292.1 hypothetical protein [Acinetobacter baumannii]EKV1917752.1 hypothetical protein [Acinetobacter baumannii]